MGSTISFISQSANSFRDTSVIGTSAGATSGTVYYVHATNGASTNAGTSTTAPLATLAQAVAKCNANSGDTVILMPGHAETLSTTTQGVNLNVAGVKIVGLGWGASTPTLTAGAAAVDAINVSAASCWLENVWVVGAASCTALINIAAADFVCKDCILQQVATPLMGVTVASGGDRFVFDGCRFFAAVDGPDVAIDIEAGVVDWTVKNCEFNYSPNGIDLAVIRANTVSTEGGLIHNCQMVCAPVVAIDFNSSSSLSGDGLISDVNISVGPTTTPANLDTVVDAGGYCLVNVLASKAAADSGSRVPVATGA